LKSTSTPTLGNKDRITQNNIAPTQVVPRSSGKIRRNLPENRRFFAGGVIPSWAKTRLLPQKMINARSETGCTKSAFRDALKSRRC
jgi:putative SOS response-associated peptidase YedK